MQKLSFTIDIAAAKARVHQLMLADDSYRQWTAVFNPNSHYIGSWESGSKICFVAIENGQPCGMVSRVLDNQPGQHVYLEHLGMLENGQEVFEGETVAAFAGAREDYLFADNPAGGCLLTVQIDCAPEWIAYFQETFPKALQRLKALCEA